MARILAVDDNREVLALIHRAAVGAGHDFEVATSGAQFMVAYNRFKPGVVIIDVIMQEVDGIELVRWLSDIGSTARIIIVSGDTFGPFGSAARKLAEARNGSDVTFLAKPFRLGQLIAAIDGRAADASAINASPRTAGT